MIAYLSGKIKYLGPNWLILDVNGIGYNIKLKIKNLKLKIGDKIDLYIHHHIREDRSELYGFKTMEELQMFELLLAVPGVGPKMGMNIISQADQEKIGQAIIRGDSGFFTSISGVGKKLATKIILELKNKFDSGDIDVLKCADLSTEIIEAMESLGYKRSEIYPQVTKIPLELKVDEEKIKWLLKHIRK